MGIESHNAHIASRDLALLSRKKIVWKEFLRVELSSCLTNLYAALSNRIVTVPRFFVASEAILSVFSVISRL